MSHNLPPHQLLDAHRPTTTALGMGVGMNHQPQGMKCLNSCKTTCSFWSMKGCAIDNAPIAVSKYKPVKVRKFGMVGRYMVKKGSR